MSYREPGCYFLTICAYENEKFFGSFAEEHLSLNPVGVMVLKWWEKLPGKFKHIELCDFVVMPNHFHGIIKIEKKLYQPDHLIIGQNGQLVNQREDTRVLPYETCPRREIREDTLVLPYETESGEKWVDTRVDPSIPRIMQWFKTMSTNEYYRMQKSSGIENKPKLWQRSYWDHIIRTDADYNRISDYIKNNPTRWVADRFHR